MIYVFAFVLVTAVGLYLYSRHDNQKIGKMEAKQKMTEDVLDDIHLVKTARDVLASNSISDSARKLRDKYTRK